MKKSTTLSLLNHVIDFVNFLNTEGCSDTLIFHINLIKYQLKTMVTVSRVSIFVEVATDIC